MPTQSSDLQSIPNLSTPQRSQTLRVWRNLMAPCCYTQTIDLHASEIAGTMRHEVVTMVLAGSTEIQIFAHYKNIYGEQILAVPDGALKQAAYAIPIAVGTLATAFVIAILHRFHKRKVMLTAVPVDHTLLSPEQLAVRERVRAESDWPAKSA